MRNVTIIAATVAMLALAPSAYAQPEAPAPEATQPQPQQPAIKKVEVVDLAELPAEQQTQVTTATSKTTDADLKGLRDSIDANTVASAALKAEGIGSEAVIAALISPDGTLTLVTRKS
jgi:hypothetical protein